MSELIEKGRREREVGNVWLQEVEVKEMFVNMERVCVYKTDIQTHRQTHRQTDRQIDRDRHTRLNQTRKYAKWTPLRLESRQGVHVISFTYLIAIQYAGSN